MSLAREALRTGIRTLAFPVMLCYVLYKMYLTVKDKPGTKNIVEAYRKLYRKLRGEKQPHAESEWSYQA